jgi:hypothetical protein
VLYRLTGARLHAEAGLGAEAEAIAREALEIVADTDLLELHGDVLVVLGDVLRRGGREQDGRDRIEQALALYERKGDVVSARAARERLGARATPA